MTEECGDNKYIKCSKCKCKYLNNEFQILKNFGFDRLQRQFKTCKKCRTTKQIKPARDLKNNIPSLDLQTLGIPEHIVTTIMQFHGEIKGMLPAEILESGWCENRKFDVLKKYIRPDNWSLKLETSSGRGGSYGRHYIIININKTMLPDLINDGTYVKYLYPTKCGLMEGESIITAYNNNFLQIGKYNLNFDKFQYINISRCYKFECYSSTDD